MGAGLAGLTAAYELTRAGYRVTVLEARPRIGGRVHTLRAPFRGGQHVEAGGEFVDVNHTRLLAYVRRFGLRLENAQAGADYDGVLYRHGRRSALPDAYPDRFDTRSEALARTIDGADPLRRGAAYDRHSVAELLDDLQIRGIPRFVADQYIRDDYGVEPERLSLLFHLSYYAISPNLPDSGIERWRIRGGNDALPRRLAHGIDVRLGQPVTRIERRATSVRAGEVEGDWCVLAAPLPALRRVEFDPPLPARLASAVADLQYGVISKTPVQYDQRFWLKRHFSGDAYTDLPMGSTWDATNAQHGGRGIMLTYASAGPGTDVRGAIADLERVYPGSARHALGGDSVHWPDDPYAGGAYTAYAPGQMKRFWAVLRARAGRLVLAGEHTDKFTGYMEGAIRSGQRAAATIRRAA